MATTNLFKVNGTAMIVPDAGVKMSFNDLDSPDSGRDESGTMQRIVSQYKVFKAEFCFTNITDEEKSAIDALFPNAPVFNFTHPSRKNAKVSVTETCYRSSYGLEWRNAKTGLWSNYKFSVIACKGESADA